MPWIKLPVMILMWAGFTVIKLVTILSGAVMLLVLYRYRHTDYEELPFWSRPWSNPEDWQGQQGHYKDSLPRWWYLANGGGFKSFYQYHAIRNPANGLRSFELLDLDIVAEKVRFKTNKEFSHYEPKNLRDYGIKTAWYFAWQGFRAGFKIVHIWNDERHLVIKFGWRVEPIDAQDIEKWFAVLKEDAGFASKFLFYREG